MSRARKVLEYGVPLLLLIPFLLYIFPTLVGASNSFIVKSGSMEPDIETGSIIFVENVSTDRINKSDIITFTSGGEENPTKTTHRVINVSENEKGTFFHTKGDANEDPDPVMVPAENVLGRFVFSIPRLGYVIRWAGTQKGFIVLLVIPATLLISKELWNIKEEIQNVEEDLEKEKEGRD